MHASALTNRLQQLLGVDKISIGPRALAPDGPGCYAVVVKSDARTRIMDGHLRIFVVVADEVPSYMQMAVSLCNPKFPLIWWDKSNALFRELGGRPVCEVCFLSVNCDGA